jgi:phosphoserine aminotransferase
MTDRVFNFYAGPAALPLSVLEKAQAELLNYHGAGMSILEMSHRSAPFAEMMAQVETDLSSLLGIPENYKVLFLQGGASLQFDMIPMNFLAQGRAADYLVTGAWGQKAAKEARKLGAVNVAASTEGTNFDRLPDLRQVEFNLQAAYLHYTSNETIHGVEWFEVPEAPQGVPLICDMSSDFLSRPVPVGKYGMIYAGAQKNAGPAGVTVVIIRDDLLEKVPENMPAMLDYRLLAEKGSLYNTPPSYAIYVVGLVARWLVESGGLPEIARLDEQKANMVYEVIDHSGGFYHGHAQPECRSRMNVTFRMAEPDLEAQFVSESKAQGLIGLKGHRSVGGLRASLYNALPVEAAEALAEFMVTFQRKHG